MSEDERTELLMLYGACWKCGGPRQSFYAWREANGVTFEAEMGLQCVDHPEHGPDQPSEGLQVRRGRAA